MPVVRSAQMKPVRFAAGGAKPATRWAALDDSSSESDCEETVVSASVMESVEVVATGPKTLPPLENDPLFIAMSRGDALWGDICMDMGDATSSPVKPVTPTPARPLVPEEALWGQTWAARLEINGGDHYDCSALSDTEWADCMTWLYAVGWYIWSEGRSGFAAIPDTNPPRLWVMPRPADSGHGHKHGHGCCQQKEGTKVVAPLSAPGTDAGRRKGVPVPRFCRAATACTDEGCRYVHGDTIPRVNRMCGFGADCGASDPTGVKRSQCLYMHPGEKWSDDLVICRPAV